MGSPPHTRGKAKQSRAKALRFRITPAHAGKSDAVRKAEIENKDHPRTRGEKRAFKLFRRVRLGSPPHTRGKETACMIMLMIIGITPAHAGKSKEALWCRAPK